MIDIEDYKRKIAKAEKEPFFLDRLNKLQSIEIDVKDALHDHKKQKTPNGNPLGPFVGGVLAIAGLIGAGTVVATSPPTLLNVGLVLVSLIGGIGGGFVIGSSIQNSKSYKDKKAKKYEGRYGREINDLKDLRIEAHVAKQRALKSFQGLPREEKLQIVALAGVADIPERTRDELVNTFRAEALDQIAAEENLTPQPVKSGTSRVPLNGPDLSPC